MQHSSINVGITQYDHSKASSSPSGFAMPPLPTTWLPPTQQQTPSNEGRDGKIISPQMDSVQDNQESWSIGNSVRVPPTLQTPSNEGRDGKIVSPQIDSVQNNQESWSIGNSVQVPKPTPSPPKTAFMIFSFNKTSATDDKDSDFDVLAEEYKKLPREEKEQWEAEARKDKVRYHTEKNNHNGPWQVPKRRARKHPLAPRRPMSAFLRFSKSCRKKVRAENPHVDNTDISRLLGHMWRNASKEEKEPYVTQELRERAIYKAEMAKWRLVQKTKEMDEIISASLRAHDSVSKADADNDMIPSHPHPIQHEQSSPEADRRSFVYDESPMRTPHAESDRGYYNASTHLQASYPDQSLHEQYMHTERTVQNTWSLHDPPSQDFHGQYYGNGTYNYEHQHYLGSYNRMPATSDGYMYADPNHDDYRYSEANDRNHYGSNIPTDSYRNEHHAPPHPRQYSRYWDTSDGGEYHNYK